MKKFFCILAVLLLFTMVGCDGSGSGSSNSSNSSNYGWSWGFRFNINSNEYGYGYGEGGFNYMFTPTLGIYASASYDVTFVNAGLVLNLTSKRDPKAPTSKW